MDKPNEKDLFAIAAFRILPNSELADAYRKAKSDESEKGQHVAWLISREIQRRSLALKPTCACKRREKC